MSTLPVAQINSFGDKVEKLSIAPRRLTAIADRGRVHVGLGNYEVALSPAEAIELADRLLALSLKAQGTTPEPT